MLLLHVSMYQYIYTEVIPFKASYVHMYVAIINAAIDSS